MEICTQVNVIPLNKMLCNNNIDKATSVISKSIGTGTVIYAPFLTKLSKSARKKNLDKSIK